MKFNTRAVLKIINEGLFQDLIHKLKINPKDVNLDRLKST